MTREEIFTVIQSNMRMIIPAIDGQEITDTKSMRDYGADSLEMVEVVSRSMKQLKIKVPRARLVPVTNLKELVDVFEEEAAKQTVTT
jgi:acyl carrier protein